MKKLIIAEKPSLGMNIVKAIGLNQFKKNDGYLESSDYIVSWGFGHLFELLSIEEYRSDYTPNDSIHWTLDGLPFKPDNFKYGLHKKPGTNTIDSGVKHQFNVIKKLCSRADVEYIIHAGDADREGEIIIRNILVQAGNNKPVMRLWLPEQTEESIRNALSTLKSDCLYDDLANEGYARTYIDWLYGVNLTRLATLKADALLRVGRVIVPIVKAIYDRDMEIKNFVPEKYLSLVSKEKLQDIEITLSSKKAYTLDELSKAQNICDLYNATLATVSNVEKKIKTVEPGKLFSLSKLQGLLGKKFKMTPKESLEIVQRLYEAGYVTYPRTNTEYLAEAEKGRVNEILCKLRASGYEVDQKDKKRIYDDKKIESHSALTPTLKLASKEDLSENEWKVYSTILNRFLAVFCSNPCTVNHTEITIDLGDLEQFKLTGDIILSRGWMEYEESSKKDKLLPQLEIGDIIPINFQVVEKETKPPNHYTSDTLSKFLKNPFRKRKTSSVFDNTDEDDELVEDSQSEGDEYKAIFDGVELGTEATRTGIIENAIRSHYISLKNDVYTILPGGIYYIETLEDLGICLSKEKTAEMGRSLKSVYHGEMSINQCVDLVFSEIQNLFDGAEGVIVDKTGAPSTMHVSFGKCPVCGEDVVENKKAFSCSNSKCGFVFFKDNKLLSSIGRKLTGTIVRSLLSEGKALLKNCKSSKTGKTFDCYLVADYTKEHPELKIHFPSEAESSLGVCPRCGGHIIKNKFGNYSCSNWKGGCKFTIYGTVSGKKLTDKHINALLTKGKTGVIKGFTSKSGKSFDAILVLGADGKVSFEFK